MKHSIHVWLNSVHHEESLRNEHVSICRRWCGRTSESSTCSSVPVECLCVLSAFVSLFVRLTDCDLFSVMKPQLIMILQLQSLQCWLRPHKRERSWWRMSSTSSDGRGVLLFVDAAAHIKKYLFNLTHFTKLK